MAKFSEVGRFGVQPSNVCAKRRAPGCMVSTRIYGSVAQTVQSRTVLYLRLIYPNPKQISTKCATEPFARLSHKYEYNWNHNPAFHAPYKFQIFWPLRPLSVPLSRFLLCGPTIADPP